MSAPKFLKARDVAELYSCDLKSVHNWVDRGDIPAEAIFRTPGRHLRFRPDLLRDWAINRGFLTPAPPPAAPLFEASPSAMVVASAVVQAHLLLCELRPGEDLAETMGQVRDLLSAAVKADPALSAAVAELQGRPAR